MNIAKNQSIALVVGAGAVQNAWTPIIRVFQPDYFKTKLSPEGATTALARMIYLLRWFSGEPNSDLFKECKQLLATAKQKIGEEIRISQQNGEIVIRDEFYHLVNQIILSNCIRFTIVSTNWDTVVEDAINKTALPQLFGVKQFDAAHIHGKYTDPKNIYLPSEMTEEPYRAKEESQYLGKMHVLALNTIRTAHTIIIYGLSISPLDAELSQILGACFDNNQVKRIIIVDPCHKPVAERINLLLMYPTLVAVHGFHPSDLAKGTDYSL